MISTTSSREKPDEVKRKALSAIICYYHPDADHSKINTKTAWANEWGIERQRFNYYERQAIDDGAIETYKKGMVPLPTQLSESGQMKSYTKLEETEMREQDEIFGELHGVDLKELEVLLKARCTRVGDEQSWASHGTVGMEPR